MSRKLLVAAGLALSLSTGQLMAQEDIESGVITCADLSWAADVLAEIPDIGLSCAAVYEKDGKLYAQIPIEVVRVRGNRMTFRPRHTDGGYGKRRSVKLDSHWRINIGGRQYRAGDLAAGQQLNIYMPEDRFVLAVADEDGLDEADMMVIEEAPVVTMPATASPLFLVGLAGGAFLALGGLLGRLRRRRG